VDTLYAAILGKGGHGAMPQKVIDPIYISAHVILALHGIVSRRLRPFDPAVISVGTIHGGTVDNVIPERVDITGTIRFLEPEVQEQIHTEIDHAIQVARTLGGDYELRIQRGYPPMHNDPAVVKLMEEVITELLGKESLKEDEPEMGAEDFGVFTAKAPGALFQIGCRIEGDERVHHNPRFDIDEGCLPIGAAILADTALRLLHGATF
jgi:amidohydrolase